MRKNIIIGYGHHAYKICDLMLSNDQQITSYFEHEEKDNNPFQLEFLGSEQEESALEILHKSNWFVAFDNNHFRKMITEKLLNRGLQPPMSIKHKKSIISADVKLGNGTMICAGAIINPLVKLGNHIILNSGTIIEHECQIGAYVHIASGAILAGNVHIGERSFVGANAVVKEGVIIGNEVRIGAGSVIIRDIPDGHTVVGNPSRVITKKY